MWWSRSQLWAGHWFGRCSLTGCIKFVSNNKSLLKKNTTLSERNKLNTQESEKCKFEKFHT